MWKYDWTIRSRNGPAVRRRVLTTVGWVVLVAVGANVAWALFALHLYGWF